jgi:hypothetical protein
VQAAPFIATKGYGYWKVELLVTAANGNDPRLTRFVSQLYSGLGREASASEQQAAIASFSPAASQGTTHFAQAGRDIAALFFNSQEYANTGHTDTEFVTDLYWTYCRRVTDPTGLLDICTDENNPTDQYRVSTSALKWFCREVGADKFESYRMAR